MQYLQLFRNRNYSILWFGTLISRLGNWFTTIGLIWFVLQLTGSTTATSLVIFSSMILAVVTGPFIGVFLDRYSIKKLMIFDNLVRALMVLLIPTLYYAGVLEVWMICVLIAIHGSMSPITAAGSRMLMPQILKEHQVIKANVLDTAQLYGSMLISPVFSGWVVELIGSVNVLFFDGLTFVVFAILLLFFKDVPKTETAHAAVRKVNNIGREMLQGMKYIVSAPAVYGLVILFFLINLAGGPLLVVLPSLVQDSFTGGADAFGMFFTALAAGSLLGSTAAGMIKRDVPLGYGLLVTAFGMGLPVLLMTFFSDNYIILLLLMAIHGFFNGPLDIYSVTLRQMLVPKQVQGQVFAATMTVNKSGEPIGTAIGGLLMLTMPVSELLLYMGVLYLVAIAIAASIKGFRNARVQPSTASVAVNEKAV